MLAAQNWQWAWTVYIGSIVRFFHPNLDNNAHVEEHAFPCWRISFIFIFNY
jgi:hypothetical protein